MPSSTTSLHPGTLVVMMGFAMAAASSKDLGVPSRYEGNTTQSAFAIYGRTSSTSPKYSTGLSCILIFSLDREDGLSPSLLKDPNTDQKDIDRLYKQRDKFEYWNEKYLKNTIDKHDLQVGRETTKNVKVEKITLSPKDIFNAFNDKS